MRIIRHLPKSVSVVRTSEDRPKPAEQTRGREREGERASRYLSVGQSQEGERKGKRKKEVSRGGRGAMLDSQCNAVALPTTNQHARTHMLFFVGQYVTPAEPLSHTWSGILQLTLDHKSASLTITACHIHRFVEGIGKQ